MKLLFWRAKPKPAPRAASASGRMPAGPKNLDGTLRFAHDYLLARGAQVRVEKAVLLAAQLPDGAEPRYTTSLARVRAPPGAELLAPGRAGLATMLGDVADHPAVLTLRLART